MIDLGVEFRRMAEEFNISDKEVLKSVRVGVRDMWSSLVFKTDFLKRNSVLIDNTNPRSKKRFPKVRKYKCAICGEYFSGTEIELDHLQDENALTEYGHINDFFTNIVLTSPDKLQVLCKDKKSKKLGVTRFGCHSIKTFASRYGVSFEQAKCEKTAIQLIKRKGDKEWLLERGITPESTQDKRRGQIVEWLLSNNSY